MLNVYLAYRIWIHLFDIQSHWFWYQSKAHLRLPISPS